jgi:predicted acetyltransferase
MTEPAAVALELATAADAPLLANLLALYMHDLSEIFAVEPDASGRFVYERLPLYTSEPGQRFAFVIRSAGRAVGFALVTRGSPASEDPEVLDVAEFFVLRRHRRSEIGKQAAFLLWNRLRGDWIVRVSEANRTGLPFWTRIIGEFTSGALTERTLPASPNAFRVFSFRS